MLNADLFKVLPDVVLLGKESAMVGLMSWPTYTHHEVVDLIDMLPTSCTDDFDRVIFFIKLYNLLCLFLKTTEYIFTSPIPQPKYL